MPGMFQSAGINPDLDMDFLFLPDKQLSAFQLFFLFAVCLLGWFFGEGGVKAARGSRLGVQVVGLEEGALLQGVGISILQSWGDRFYLCCSCYLYKGKGCFILESANRKVLETVGDVLYLQLGL